MSFDNFVRVNEKIRISPILVVRNNENLGLMSTNDALKLAREHGEDLVEISPHARPPVCRIVDYGKLKYEKSQKEKQQHKQHAKSNKEIRLRPVTGEHDLATKIKQIKEFLAGGHNVLLSVKFKAREIQHKAMGTQMIEKIVSEVAEVGSPIGRSSLMGKTLTCVLGPKKT